MKTGSLQEVRNNLSRVIDGLPKTGPVLITKSGKASREVDVPGQGPIAGSRYNEGNAAVGPV